MNAISGDWASRVVLPTMFADAYPELAETAGVASGPPARFAELSAGEDLIRPLRPALGLAYIGQVAGRTRPNATEALYAELLPGWDIVAYGGLDGLSGEAIAALREAPITGHRTRASLANGDQIVLSQEVYERHLDVRIAQMARVARMRASVVLCTLDFSALHVPPRHVVIQPNAILRGAVSSCAFAGPLGVVVPLPAQRGDAVARWHAATERDVVAVAVPATQPFDRAQAERAAADLARSCVGMTVLDCMGYRADLHGVVSEVTAAPTLLPPRTVAEVVKSMLA